MTYLDKKSPFRIEAEEFLQKIGFEKTLSREAYERGLINVLFNGNDITISYKDRQIVTLKKQNDLQSLAVNIKKLEQRQPKQRFTKPDVEGNFRASFSDGFVSVINVDTGMVVVKHGIHEGMNKKRKHEIVKDLKRYGLFNVLPDFRIGRKKI
jgi:hypothetical protein